MQDPIERADALAAIAIGDTVNQLQAKIRAIPRAPVIDPATIREAALREAATLAACVGVYPALDIIGGGPDWYRHGKEIEKAILALIGEKK